MQNNMEDMIRERDERGGEEQVEGRRSGRLLGDLLEQNMNYFNADSLERVHTLSLTSFLPDIIPLSSSAFLIWGGDDRSRRGKRKEVIEK